MYCIQVWTCIQYKMLTPFILPSKSGRVRAKLTLIAAILTNCYVIDVTSCSHSKSVFMYTIQEMVRLRRTK